MPKRRKGGREGKEKVVRGERESNKVGNGGQLEGKGRKEGKKEDTERRRRREKRERE